MDERQKGRGGGERNPAEARAAKIQQLRALVQAGQYPVDSLQLARAMLAWEPDDNRRHANLNTPDPKLEARQAHRTEYMREYMKQRRAEGKAK